MKARISYVIGEVFRTEKVELLDAGSLGVTVTEPRYRGLRLED
jgi:hypothetical protein